MSNNNHTQNYSIGYGTYIMVWLGLVALTAITVSVAGLNLGNVTIVAALLIATVKSALVGNYFMHLKFEHRVFRVFVVVCIITFIVLFVLTFSDLSFR